MTDTSDPSWLAKFENRVIRTDECWEWSGAHNTAWNGARYSQLYNGHRKVVYAHRFAYEHWIGPIPEKYDIDHLCKNPGCVNPSHLEAVPHATNLRRGKAATKTECKYGHDWSDPKNVYIRHSGPAVGTRYCAECQRQSNKKWRENR